MVILFGNLKRILEEPSLFLSDQKRYHTMVINSVASGKYSTTGKPDKKPCEKWH